MMPQDMANLTQGFEHTSEKIRALFKAGYQQAKIARFLGTSDQYVSNVVRAMKGKEIVQRQEEASVPESYRVKIGPAGRIVIPASFRERLGLEEGREIIVRFEEDSLRIENAVAGLKRAQKLMEEFGIKGGGMADELIRERREEAARDQ